MGSRYRDIGLFLIAATLTGGVYVANTVGLSHLPPVFFASLRFLVAAALLLPYVAFRSEPLRPRTHASVGSSSHPNSTDRASAVS